MVGNVYVKFEDEEAAEKSIQKLFGRYYAGRPLACEYSPVTDFRESRCRQFDEGTCSRGGYCNFMHVREPSRDLRKHLEKVSETRCPCNFSRNLDFEVEKFEALDQWQP